MNYVMKKDFGNHKNRLACLAVMTGGLSTACPVLSDEGGISFWLPGQYGSFSAVPVDQGWSLGSVYYHTSTTAEGARQFPLGGEIVAGMGVDADLVFLAPSYAFADEIWGGGQLALGITGVLGQVDVGVDATFSDPGGNTFSGRLSDAEPGIGDLYPYTAVRWNSGSHNFMAYTMAGVPVGDYDQNNLANIGTNHWSLDLGGGYSYLNTGNGREFSAVLGFTYNFENPDTDYQNGVSAHLDWAASQFLSETFHIGLVGYVYDQVSGDSGDGARLGDFESYVAAVGPEVGWFLHEGSWYLNFKGYYEFDSENRPDGWNTWVTLSIPL